MLSKSFEVKTKMTASHLRFAFLLLLIAVWLVPGAVAEGAAQDLYKSKCAMCHGPDGSGNTAMGKKLGAHDFASPEVQKQTAAQLTEIIAKGKNKMPAYSGKISDEQIKQLVAHIRTFKK
jgi:mono/diheme cytochrome c family protein